MNTGKSLLILGITIALSTLLFGLIFAYLRTRPRQTPGFQNYNQGVERLKLAIRLVCQVKTKNPAKAVDWYVEKAFYDLERDRGR